MKILIKTNEKQEAVDITEKINEKIKDKRGNLCLIYSPHTTSGLLINEGHDKDVIKDILETLDKIAPEKGNYRHKEGNSPAHIKSSLIGNFLVIPIEDSKLKLGKWQRVFFLEFDGWRNREIEIVIT